MNKIKAKRMMLERISARPRAMARPRAPSSGAACVALATDVPPREPWNFSGVGSRGLLGRVLHSVGMDIVSGRLKPEQGLPNEADWSEQLGISRTVLREATKILISKGLVESRPRTGTRVRSSESWNLLDPDVLVWQLDAAPRDRFVGELFELRRLVEPAIAFMAATRASERHLTELDAAYQAMIEAGDDGLRFIGPDTRFHRTILNSVDNSMLRSLGSAIETALNLSLRLSINTPHGQRHSIPLHGAVLNAIRRRDGAAAERAMGRLIDAAEKDVRRALGLPRRSRSQLAKRSRGTP